MKLNEIKDVGFMFEEADRLPGDKIKPRKQIPIEMRKLINKHFPDSNAMLKGNGASGFKYDDCARASYGRININFVQSANDTLRAEVEVFGDNTRDNNGKNMRSDERLYVIKSEKDLEKIKADYPVK